MLWFDAPVKGGGIRTVTAAHAGEVYTRINGEAVASSCPVCNRSLTMPCPSCKGVALVICTTCKGQKEYPDPAAPARPAETTSVSNAAAVAAKSSETIRLKNGQTVVGNIVIRDAQFIIVRTPEGKSQQIEKSDIVP